MNDMVGYFVHYHENEKIVVESLKDLIMIRY